MSGEHELTAAARAYIERVVEQMRCRQGLRVEVRRELAAHFEDALAHCADDAERDKEAEALISEFGDTALLAELLQRGKKRRDPGVASGVAGLGLIGFLIAGCILLGSPLGIFINIPSAVLAVAIPLALAVATYSGAAVLLALRAAIALVWNLDPESISRDAPVVLRALGRYTYASIPLALLIAFIQILTNLNDPSQVGPALAVTLLAPLYAILVAEGLWRPAAARAEFLCSLAGTEPGPDVAQ